MTTLGEVHDAGRGHWLNHNPKYISLGSRKPLHGAGSCPQEFQWRWPQGALHQGPWQLSKCGSKCTGFCGSSCFNIMDRISSRCPVISPDSDFCSSVPPSPTLVYLGSVLIYSPPGHPSSCFLIEVETPVSSSLILVPLLWDPHPMAVSRPQPQVLTSSYRSAQLSPAWHWVNKQIPPNGSSCCQAHFTREKGIFIYQKCIYFKGAYHSLKFARKRESQENQGHLHYNPPKCPKISSWTCRILRKRVLFAYLQEKRMNFQGKEGTEVENLRHAKKSIW